MRTLLRLSLAAAAAVALACKPSPKEAREELARLNVPFTAEEFVSRCGFGPTNLIDTFLKAGADPNVVIEEGRSYTPLIGAAESGRVDIARQLLQAGARVDLRTGKGRSALNAAAGNCKEPEMVRLLLDSGARPDEQSLFLAIAHSGQPQSACSHANLLYLLEAGADANRPNARGVTPLMLATERNDEEAVQLLKKYRDRVR